MGGTFTHRFGVTANDTPDDLSDLFANGEIGDWWHFDTENSTANEAGQIGVATGIVNGNLLVQATAGLKPTRNTGLGDKECARFSTSLMTWAIGSTVAQPGTIIIAVGDTDTSSHAIVTGSSTTLRWQISNNTSDNIIMYAGATLDSTVDAGFGTKVFTGEFNGASSKFRENGTETATGNAGSQGTNQLTVGGVWDGTAFATMNVYSLLFINRVLTADEMDRAERLLGSHATLSW